MTRYICWTSLGITRVGISFVSAFPPFKHYKAISSSFVYYWVHANQIIKYLLGILARIIKVLSLVFCHRLVWNKYFACMKA